MLTFDQQEKALNLIEVFLDKLEDEQDYQEKGELIHTIQGMNKMLDLLNSRKSIEELVK